MRFGTIRAGLAGLTLALLALAASPAVPAAPEEGFIDLFNGKDLKGFKTLPEKDADKIWSVQEGVIVCVGKPAGYFYTEKSYKNYTLRFDWKYARPKDLTDDAKFGGNSGCLVHITGEHKTWPKCVEVQGANSEHGRIFAISGAKGKFEFKADELKKVRKPVGEWNTTEVICQDGKITSKVNDVQVSTGEGDEKEGQIGWQSEGAEIHFKNIKIKEMK